MSQEELAFQCGLHRTSVSQIERGINSPTVETLGKIAASLGTTPSELLAEVERRSQVKAKRP